MPSSDFYDGCKYRYLRASGIVGEVCMVLGYRTLFETPFSPFEMESWVMEAESEGNEVEVFFEYGYAGWATGLWRSLEGPVFVAEAEERVRIRGGDRNEPWQEVKLDVRLRGVWGLSDKCVYVWGRVKDDFRMFHYDGQAWNPMPSPGDMAIMHGVAPDLLYAAGYGGTMWRWDGQAWTPVPIATRSNFLGLFVAGPDEMYATTERGELWEGTSHGWSKRAEIEEGSLLDVAKFNDEVWVAGGEAGLLRLKGRSQELECVKPNVEATRFDARRGLLITTDEMIVETQDGRTFQSLGEFSLREARANQPKMWEED